MKASAWSGCWAVGTVIPQWMPCPLDATIWEDALALCSRETCLLWLDKYIRIHNTELAISRDHSNIPQQTSGELWCIHRMGSDGRTAKRKNTNEWGWGSVCSDSHRQAQTICGDEIPRGVLEILEMWAALRGKSGSGDNGLSAASERLPKQHWNTL